VKYGTRSNLQFVVEVNKRFRIPQEQSKMDNLEKMVHVVYTIVNEIPIKY